MYTIDDILKLSRKEAEEYFNKHDKAFLLLLRCGNPLVKKFFNTDSFDILDEKIEVLEALNAGKVPAEIPNFYDILEDYPKESKNGDIAEDIRWDL